ncbi:Chemotaxis regulator - transmits chemoreceptor signals to flagellar motor components CheY [hydrothermal vent metagenome]|uniref:Chemotaxis regulator - transmits chemoreceptor signals to flagellar motor components CheY n=1 Tax=hydrothermal vent metagenome TaxID=652676 RepID=A0A3B0W169_9ZZZZ
MPKILAVDDSKSMRQMVSMSLKSAGHDVTEAEDGAIALAIAQKEQFDLVVTDINMPNMNGIELVTALRAMPNYKFTPLLCLTTESSGDMKAKGKTAGATGWIVKPFSPEKLLSVINRVL